MAQRSPVPVIHSILLVLQIITWKKRDMQLMLGSLLIMFLSLRSQRSIEMYMWDCCPVRVIYDWPAAAVASNP